MMMLLRHSTICIPSNQTGQDSRLSNQAELSPLSFTCKQKLFGCFREKCQNSCDKITGSGKLQRRKHSIFSESGQVPDRDTCGKRQVRALSGEMTHDQHKFIGTFRVPLLLEITNPLSKQTSILQLDIQLTYDLCSLL